MTDFDVQQRYYRMMLLLFGLWFAAMALFQFVVMPLLAWAFVDYEAFKAAFGGKVPDLTTGQNRIAAIASLLVRFLLPPIALAKINKEPVSNIIGSIRVPPTTLLVLGFSAIILSIPFIFMSYEVNQNLPMPDDFVQWEQQIGESQNKMLAETGAMAILGNILLLVVVAPIAEETFFRGALQRLLWRINGSQHLAIILAAAAFSSIHMQFAGFIPRMILGMVLGYMAMWSGNLLVPIFCHAVYNGSQLALAYLFANQVIENPDKVSVPVYLSLFSVITTALILKQFYTRAIIKPNMPNEWNKDG